MSHDLTKEIQTWLCLLRSANNFKINKRHQLSDVSPRRVKIDNEVYIQLEM
jgi:hypothetical protein